MRPSLASGSLLLFLISLLMLVFLTLFEPVLTGISTGAERVLSALLLVLPAGTGAVAGILSLAWKEARRGLAALGIVLNSLFALFHLLVLMLAG